MKKSLLKLVVIDAPSNLGLSPPAKHSVPGCYKMPWVLHNLGLLKVLDADYHGTLIPPRYNGYWEEGMGDRNAVKIADYSVALAQKVEEIIRQKNFPIVIGGDCSILIGNALALRNLGNYGLVFVDAHSDYRHPGNSKNIRAAAGEDLAIITGKGDHRLINIGGQEPYIHAANVISLGILASDEHIPEMQNDGIRVFTNQDSIAGMDVTLALDKLKTNTDGFWVHMDFDVIDKTEMTAVDCPEDTGVLFNHLANILRPIITRPECVGINFTIYDPDLDPDFEQGKKVLGFIKTILASKKAVT